MFNAKYAILSTKALPPELKEEAAGHGIAVEDRMFIDVTAVTTEEIEHRIMSLSWKSGVLVFTSRHAVGAVSSVLPSFLWEHRLPFHGPQLADVRVYCLQGATRQAVEENMPGILIAGTAANGTELAQKIMEDQVPAVTFLCGNIRRGELPDTLRAHNIAVEEMVVYNTTETPTVVEKEYDGILFSSPSGVRSFFSVNTPPRHTVCFAIGETTAAALRDVTDNRVITSHEPSADALLGTAIYYFDNINCYE
ncbi:uroporphyrinogen-III synthase [Chitinophaga alhagiae]|uniref:uroporphyrinogen-III synthase n=1 Tax=Chitinophaga alhagiae TaxID=2203219 RepID=UPI000E5B7E9A|nr:uroporphyrinogen-III synthase [Chitinophaga alhagiae]